MGVDVGNLLIEAAFGGPDVPDAFEQLVEIVCAEASPFFEPFVVHRKALDEILVKTLGGPSSKLCAATGAYAVADRKNHLQVVVIDLAGNLSLAFGLNY